MDLSELIRNLRRVDVIKEIEESIKKVKEEYKGLITIQTCKIYSSLLYEELSSRHVPVRLVSTGDLGLTYDHMFIIANEFDLRYYLIDLTYGQFNNNSFEKLNKKGYQVITDEEISKYLEIVSEDKNDLKLDYLYYGNFPKKKSI